VTFLSEDDFYSVRLLVSCQTPKLEDHQSYILYNFILLTPQKWEISDDFIKVVSLFSRRIGDDTNKSFIILVNQYMFVFIIPNATET